MDKELQDAREDYQKDSLNETQVSVSPFSQFEEWFLDYKNTNVRDYNAMVLSTVGLDGGPSSRIVLLKGFDNIGFNFYTNYNSNKGQEMTENAKVALNFFWPNLERQIRIEGIVNKMDASDSDSYFASRPRASQIGAWVSPQSTIIESRAILEKEELTFIKKFEGKEIPRPEHWGGYIVQPNYFEFWQGRTSRLHDRISFKLKNGRWENCRLAP